MQKKTSTPRPHKAKSALTPAEQAAHNLYNYMESQPATDFMNCVLIDVIEQAGAILKVETPDYLNKAETVRRLTRLFAAMPPLFSLRRDHDSNEALALHLSEAIRIANERDDLPVSLVNDLHETTNNFLNNLPSLGEFNDSEPVIKLALDAYLEQTTARKGGSRR